MSEHEDFNPPSEPLRNPVKTEDFDTGAVREERPSAKGAYHLISPLALHRLSQTMAEGAKKYADRNWEKGIPMSKHIDSAIRHLYQYLAGLRDEDHLAHAMANCMMAMHTECCIRSGELPAKLNDLPDYQARGLMTFEKTFEELTRDAV